MRKFAAAQHERFARCEINYASAEMGLLTKDALNVEADRARPNSPWKANTSQRLSFALN
jgi:hypothetical protein